MPPKPKFTREEIVQTALDIVSRKGVEALTAKELGDAAWYLAVSADALGYPLERVLRMNLDKLRARYPDGFDPGRSRERPREDV